MYQLLRLSRYPSLYGNKGSLTYRVAHYGSQAKLLALLPKYPGAVVVPVRVQS